MELFLLLVLGVTPIIFYGVVANIKSTLAEKLEKENTDLKDRIVGLEAELKDTREFYAEYDLYKDEWLSITWKGTKYSAYFMAHK